MRDPQARVCLRVRDEIAAVGTTHRFFQDLDGRWRRVEPRSRGLFV